MKKTIANFAYFEKLDIRVGSVINAQYVQGSKKLLLLIVDLGKDYNTVKILTGLAQWYKPQDFMGKKFLFLANLPPRSMAGHISAGMLLTGIGEDNQPLLVEVSTNLNNGLVII